MSHLFPQIGIDFYSAASPILLACIGSILCLILAVGKPWAQKASVFAFYLTLAFILVSAVAGFSLVSDTFLMGGFIHDQITSFGISALTIITLFIGLSTFNTIHHKKFHQGEVLSLFLMMLAGLFVTLSSHDFISIFVGIEMSAIGLYALVGYVDNNQKSREGALKYFVMGSVGAAFLLFGMALMYAASGTMYIMEMFNKGYPGTQFSFMFMGAIFLIVGLTLKLSLVPFHLWAPDAYEGAATPITAFMATAAKMAIVFLLIRILVEARYLALDVWRPALTILAVLTVVIGNIMALVQSSVKRLLAYSSVAHSGYIAIGFAAIAPRLDDFTIKAIVFYIVVYSIISIGAFSVLMWLESDKNKNIQINDLLGLAKKHPWAAFALTIFMFSFAGLPPTAGFMGKLFLFKAAVNQKLFALVLFGVLGSAISLYYYLRVIVNMYMREPGPTTVTTTTKLPNIAMTVAVMVVLAMALGTFLPGQGLQTVALVTKVFAGY